MRLRISASTGGRARSVLLSWPGIATVVASPTFAVVWTGQVVSILGSGVTNFAVGIWVFRTTGSATLFSLVLLSGIAPGLLVSPIGGAVVDLLDRRRVMIACDALLALRTAVLAGILAAGRLEIWHLVVSLAIGSTAGGFRRPAYEAALPSLVPARYLAPANALIEFGHAVTRIAAPLLAGMLLPALGLGAILGLDLMSFAVSVASLVLVRFPGGTAGPGTSPGGGVFWRDVRAGWEYVLRERGLLHLAAIFAVLNLGLSLSHALLTPLVLSFASEAALGFVASFASSGLLVGSLLMTSWRRPGSLIEGVLACGILMGCGLVLTGLRPSLLLIGVGHFVVSASVPLGNACSRAVWQMKAPAHLQGRVSAVRVVISWATVPVAYLIAGPLTDLVFEPLARAVGGTGWGPLVVGGGVGRGPGLFLIAGGALVLLSAWLARRSRELGSLEPLPAATPGTPLPGRGAAPSPTAASGG